MPDHRPEHRGEIEQEGEEDAAIEAVPAGVGSQPVQPPAATSLEPVRAARDAYASKERMYAIVKQRLELESAPLIEEIQKHVLSQFQSEEDRNKILDTKATSLLTVTGLSFTVAFSFGASVLVKDAENLEALGATGYRVLVIGFMVAMAVGILAGVFALLAMRIREFRGIATEDVFQKEVLDLADREPVTLGVATYRRYIAAHIWRVTQENAATCDAKAKDIWIGQRLFVAFLACVLLVAAGVAVAAYRRGLPSHAAAQETTIGVSAPKAPALGAGSPPLPALPPAPVSVPALNPPEPSAAGETPEPATRRSVLALPNPGNGTKKQR